MFTGIPNFAPEMFRRVVLRDPLRMKALAEGPRPAVRGGRHAGVPAAAQQRPDPRRGRHAAVRRGGVPPAGRVRRAVHLRQRQRLHGALGVRQRREEARGVPRQGLRATSRSITRGRWSTSRRRASTCSSRSSAGRTSRSGRRVSTSPRPRSVLATAAGGRLGVLRLGELGVRDHGDGRVLPGVLPAVLERRRRGDREHLPARHRQRHRRSLCVALLAPVLGAIADRGGARMRFLMAVTVLGCGGHRWRWRSCGRGTGGSARAAVRRRRRSASGAASSSTTRCCSTSRQPEEYDLRLGLRLRARLPRRRPAVRGQRADDAASPQWFGLADAARGRARLVRDGRCVVARCSRCRARCSCASSATPGAACRWRRPCARDSRELRGTLREIARYRPLLWFLAAYWLYIDGVNTIIKMAVDYGLSLGFDQSHLIEALLLTQFVAFPAALAFGWLGSRIGAREGIFLALAVYAGRDLLRLLPQRGPRLLRAGGRRRPGAGRHPVAEPLATSAGWCRRASRRSSSASTT